MMRKRLWLMCVAVGLAGCGTVPLQPHTLVSKMSADHPKYATEDCRQARAAGLAYDDNVAGRAGLGLGLAIFLGPFGIPFAIAADSSQAAKREAVVAEIKKACMTAEEVERLKPPEPPGGRPSGPRASWESSQGSQQP